jgi:dTDP-4-amino-4,6-dideoxygalactose transaminase
VPDTDIPISKPVFDGHTIDLLEEVLNSGRLAQGPMVERFEELVAEAAGTQHAVAVTSGTTALVAPIEALDLQPGDEVLTSPFTFAATLNAILEAGATARFADIGADFNIDPDQIEATITPRTKVIMPVHLYGLPADMPRIADIAQTHGLVIVEDAAQSIGSTVAGRPVGSFGIGAFSFYATKNVTTGEGGVITTNDADLADRVRILRNQGMKQRYEYVVPGHNYRMTELQAAVGIPQMERLAEVCEERRANAGRLIEGLADLPGLVVPTIPEGRTHVFNQFTVRVEPDAPTTRDQLAADLTRAGIGNGLYYPNLVFDYDCYRSHPGVEVAAAPHAARIVDEVLSLPVHPSLTDPQIDRVIDTVRGAFDR